MTGTTRYPWEHDSQPGREATPESIERFIEGKAFSRSYDLAPRPPPAHPFPPVNKTEKERQLADGRGEGGWAKSRIIRLHESLVLFKSFNTLCSHVCICISPPPICTRMYVGTCTVYYRVRNRVSFL